jgi:hypothetical protein
MGRTGSTRATLEEERLHISVSDTGIGIAADRLHRIFEPFVQVRMDFTRTAQGSGLGLAISRDLARGMAGDLIVESTAARGSTFTLALPRGITSPLRRQGDPVAFRWRKATGEFPHRGELGSAEGEATGSGRSGSHPATIVATPSTSLSTSSSVV